MNYINKCIQIFLGTYCVCETRTKWQVCRGKTSFYVPPEPVVRGTNIKHQAPAVTSVLHFMHRSAGKSTVVPSIQFVWSLKIIIRKKKNGGKIDTVVTL